MFCFLQGGCLPRKIPGGAGRKESGAVRRLQSLRRRRPRWQRWDTGDELWRLHPLLFRPELSRLSVCLLWTPAVCSCHRDPLSAFPSQMDHIFPEVWGVSRTKRSLQGLCQLLCCSSEKGNNALCGEWPLVGGPKPHLAGGVSRADSFHPCNIDP